MEVSGQRHASAALYPWERTPVPMDSRLAGLDAKASEKIMRPRRGSNPGRSVRSQSLYWLRYSGEQKCEKNTGIGRERYPRAKAPPRSMDARIRFLGEKQSLAKYGFLS